MTAILAAMESELKAVVSAMSVSTEETVGRTRMYRGSLAGKEVVAAKTGIGKTLSAIATQIIVDRYKPSVIIYVGIAGSLNKSYNIGDIVIARDYLQYDIDLTSQSFLRGEIPFEGIRIIPCDPALVKIAAERKDPKHRVHIGRVLTGDQFVVDPVHTDMLRNELEGDAVEMEGASAGLAAFINDIPHLLVRVISDKSDGKLPSDFKGFLREASDALLGVVFHVLTDAR